MTQSVSMTAAELTVILSVMRWAKEPVDTVNPLVAGPDYATLAAKLETARVTEGGIPLAPSFTGEVQGG